MAPPRRRSARRVGTREARTLIRQRAADAATALPSAAPLALASASAAAMLAMSTGWSQHRPPQPSSHHPDLPDFHSRSRSVSAQSCSLPSRCFLRWYCAQDLSPTQGPQQLPPQQLPRQPRPSRSPLPSTASATRPVPARGSTAPRTGPTATARVSVPPPQKDGLIRWRLMAAG